MLLYQLKETDALGYPPPPQAPAGQVHSTPIAVSGRGHTVETNK